MQYHRIDNTYFISLIDWLPSCLVFEIVEFIYTKCVDCKYYLTKNYVCRCGLIRCELHNF